MLPDAEDLAQERSEAGMKNFDPARGDFGAFCRTIMANRAISFHRSARPQDSLPDDGGEFVDPDGSPEWALYSRQCHATKSDRRL